LYSATRALDLCRNSS